MLFHKQNSLYRLFFFFFFIFKKKKLGYKKVQWKLSSFFHMNRMKYFFYFIKKVFMYKKYFFYFFLKHNLSTFFKQVVLYFTFLDLPVCIIAQSSYFSNMVQSSIFTVHETIHLPVTRNSNIDYLFRLFSCLSFFKILYIIFKNLNVSYFALPIRRNKYTILRSPHIDKKSREQFELKHFSIVLNELSMFSLGNNCYLKNQFSFFMSGFKIDEKMEQLIK